MFRLILSCSFLSLFFSCRPFLGKESTKVLASKDPSIGMKDHLAGSWTTGCQQTSENNKWLKRDVTFKDNLMTEYLYYYTENTCANTSLLFEKITYFYSYTYLLPSKAQVTCLKVQKDESGKTSVDLTANLSSVLAGQSCTPNVPEECSFNISNNGEMKKCQVGVSGNVLGNWSYTLMKKYCCAQASNPTAIIESHSPCENIQTKEGTNAALTEVPCPG